MCGVDHAAALRPTAQCVKVIDDAVIEAVELRPLCVRGSGVGTDGAEEASGQRGVDAFEQLEENQAERVSMGEKLIAAGIWKLSDETFGPKLNPSKGEWISNPFPSTGQREPHETLQGP